ncbi:MAG TPA: hypothetical protein VKP08_11260 [Anaerolineales bacterium]|nr:hypothetical protein [Anaerolineales bacterium]
MNRKRWITGAILLVLLLILCIAGSVRAWNERQPKPGVMGHHEPLPGFGYCSSLRTKPCILAFNLNKDGGMLINVLTDSLQDFSIQVRDEEGERTYECKRVREYSANVTCTGETLPVGKTLNFLVIAKKDDTPFAQGSFPVIGMALATPQIRITPTPFTNHEPR